jgi:hypothetical protein
VGHLDPVVYIAPMALATESVGFAVTATSSYLSKSLRYRIYIYLAPLGQAFQI